MIEVSICVITYNHEKFITQALKSIMEQQFDFDYEVVISNDCSQDNTHLAITNYLKNIKHKETIKYFNQKSNLGMLANLIFTIQMAQGKYIAFLEGDDYWTNVNKLRKQIHIFRNRPDISVVCGGNVVIRPNNESVNKLMSNIIGEKIEFDIFSFQSKIKTHFQTLMIRNIPNAVMELREIKRAKDFSIFFLFLKYGNGIYVNELWSVYRMHQNGIWSPKLVLNNLKWEYEEAKQLFQVKENKRFIRKKYLFDTLNYLNVSDGTLSKSEKLKIISKISFLPRNSSEIKQFLYSLFIIATK